MGKTTVKLVDFEYGALRTSFNTPPATYTKCQGLLKGFAIAQDDPDAKEIESELYDSPWDIIYTGKPIKMTFSLVNYELSELPPLFGGTYTAASYTSVLAVTDTAPATAAIGDKYVAPTAKKLFTATAANTWDAGTALVSATAYYSKLDGKIYVYDGTTVAKSDTDAYNENYMDSGTVFTSEHEWKVTFQRGFQSFIVFDGITVGKTTKAADGALAYEVTVTSKILKIGTDTHIYKILGRKGV